MPGGRRWPALLAAAALAAVVLTVATSVSTEWRLIAPHVYLVAGYWTPALLVPRERRTAPPGRFEAWLIRTDAILRPRLPGVPPRVVSLTELAYLFCYPLVPIAYALAWWRATPVELDRFWFSVLCAGYACYATLPILPSRPPRLLGVRPSNACRTPRSVGPFSDTLLVRSPAEPRGVRAVNALVLGRFSHGWNTFPSGHVAVATAAALALGVVWPAAGACLGAIAAAVAVGAAAGRYHYVVDVLAGVLVGALATMITW